MYYNNMTIATCYRLGTVQSHLNACKNVVHVVLVLHIPAPELWTEPIEKRVNWFNNDLFHYFSFARL